MDLNFLLKLTTKSDSLTFKVTFNSKIITILRSNFRLVCDSTSLILVSVAIYVVESAWRIKLLNYVPTTTSEMRTVAIFLTGVSKNYFNKIFNLYCHISKHAWPSPPLLQKSCKWEIMIGWQCKIILYCQYIQIKSI